LRSSSSSRKNKAARAAGADRASGKKADDTACAAGAARASADDPAHDLNDDYCTVCRGAAIDDEPKEPLYCCDTCSRSFHAFCIKDLYAPNWTADDLPSSWHCHFCTGGDKQADDDACAAGAARAAGKQAEDAAVDFGRLERSKKRQKSKQESEASRPSPPALSRALLLKEARTSTKAPVGSALFILNRKSRKRKSESLHHTPKKSKSKSAS